MFKILELYSIRVSYTFVLLTLSITAHAGK